MPKRPKAMKTRPVVLHRPEPPCLQSPTLAPTRQPERGPGMASVGAYAHQRQLVALRIDWRCAMLVRAPRVARSISALTCSAALAAASGPQQSSTTGNTEPLCRRQLSVCLEGAGEYLHLHLRRLINPAVDAMMLAIVYRDSSLPTHAA